jgi:hypothetical protein
MPDPYQQHLDALTAAISAERLSGYRRPSDADALDVLARYAWNVVIAESLYPTLQCLEIALRNTLHTAVAAHVASPQWLTAVPTVLAPREVTAVAEAVQLLARQHKPLTAGRLVAELSFGFWTSLLDRRYEPALWPALLKRAFPTIPRRQRTRHELSRRFTEIRRLRNRVFHHEPIWHWRDLPQQHANLIETLVWINPALARTVAAFDRFPAVYGAGVAPLRAQLEPITRTP